MSWFRSAARPLEAVGGTAGSAFEAFCSPLRLPVVPGLLPLGLPAGGTGARGAPCPGDAAAAVAAAAADSASALLVLSRLRTSTRILTPRSTSCGGLYIFGFVLPFSLTVKSLNLSWIFSNKPCELRESREPRSPTLPSEPRELALLFLRLLLLPGGAPLALLRLPRRPPIAWKLARRWPMRCSMLKRRPLDLSIRVLILRRRGCVDTTVEAPPGRDDCELQKELARLVRPTGWPPGARRLWLRREALLDVRDWPLLGSGRVLLERSLFRRSVSR
mmetsp:Transcript_54796/g.159865  ORF Transcript_54796/g.159865 Transcript_54796/m.159865 type:complete len:275 (+) Transcript_54796:347-1171(+)